MQYGGNYLLPPLLTGFIFFNTKFRPKIDQLDIVRNRNTYELRKYILERVNFNYTFTKIIFTLVLKNLSN